MTDPKEPEAPDFSDVVSGGSSTAPPAKKEPKTYTIAKGDTLSKIAKRELGDANKWRLIYDANKDTIKNPDVIFPGQTIQIPQE
jgi:nucleoid-associated protein YgaU